MKKRFPSLLLAMLLLAGMLTFPSCASRRAPKVEQIYDRVVELVESAYALNTVFYGAGLAILDRNSPRYADTYADSLLYGYVGNYDVVSPHALFASEEEIRLVAEKVFSEDFLKNNLFVNAFEGQVLTDVSSTPLSERARYQTYQEYFLCSRESKSKAVTNQNANLQPLMFDYATMKVVKPSNATTVRLTLDAWEVDAPDTRMTFRLVITKNADGVWLLDKLTV